MSSFEFCFIYLNVSFGGRGASGVGSLGKKGGGVGGGGGRRAGGRGRARVPPRRPVWLHCLGVVEGAAARMWGGWCSDRESIIRA